MRRIKIWLMIVALVASAGTLAMAQEPSRRMPPGPPPHDRLSTVLGLSDEQKAAWEAARKDAGGTLRPLREQAWVLQREIDGLLDQASPDPAVVGQKVMALRQLRLQLRNAHEALDDRLASLLTPEQKLKFDAFKAALPPPGPRGPGMGPGARGARPPGPHRGE